MPICQNCGEHITRRYLQVCTDGEAHNCPHCDRHFTDSSPVPGTLYSLRHP